MDFERYKMTYFYKKNQNEIRIFSKRFIQNNANRGRLIIKNKKYKLTQFLKKENIPSDEFEIIYLNKDEIPSDKFEIGLILNNNNFDKSYMFFECEALLKFSGYEKNNYGENEENFDDPPEEEKKFLIQKYFSKGINFPEEKEKDDDTIYIESEITENETEDNDINILSEINKLISNESTYYTNLKGMFSFCGSLKSLHNVNIFKNRKIIDISLMFERCQKLESLPSVFSELNTNSTFSMERTFFRCPELKSLPDLSKWDTSNVLDMTLMFYNCSKLENFPDISNWKTKNVRYLENMFYHCRGLKFLGNSLNWDISNVFDISGMFSYCDKLSKIPDISHWNTSNVNSMTEIFSNCKLLTSLPNLSKWNTQNLIKMNKMFEECNALTFLPDLSK